ncbi:hypothetical protein MNBD_NITROSPINAE01-1301 [hydrothermal vent metagenome]|uniref:Uncharacterized protein n=1 Tax=hydrothermal vent metagenome TaxID=652676 RepID=A0A3B1BTN7_9ZZZZ
MWLNINELSADEKKVRALYQSLRDDLQQNLIDFALVESYENFLKAGEHYPFVEKRELKPRAKVHERENSLMNSFIVLFTEYPLTQSMKKNIRYFDSNKVTKENFGEMKLTSMKLADRFQAQQKYFESDKFYDLLRSLLSVDYALLIQRDTTVKQKNRFLLSHFHVRIDWLIDSAAESLGKELRYISKDLYERGEEYAQEMGEKLFEYYSFHHSVAGRRTAAMLAAQFLRQASKSLSTVFVSSSESRTITTISENGASKGALIQLDKNAIKAIEEHPNGDPQFRKKFLIHETADYGVAKFLVVYAANEHSKPPADGKLRELKADVQWQRIRKQLLIPISKYSATRPIRYQIIYDQQDPLS